MGKKNAYSKHKRQTGKIAGNLYHRHRTNSLNILKASIYINKGKNNNSTAKQENRRERTKIQMTFKPHALLRELSDGRMLICSFVSLNFITSACNARFKKNPSSK